MKLTNLTALSDASGRMARGSWPVGQGTGQPFQPQSEDTGSESVIALTVQHYFLVVNLMAIPPGLWFLALAQGFLDMSLPVRRLGVD